MANNITIADFNTIARILKTVDNANVHTVAQALTAANGLDLINPATAEQQSAIITVLTGGTQVAQALLYDGFGSPIKSVDGALDVHRACAHSTFINRCFAYQPETITSTLSAPAAAGATQISVQVGDHAGFANGNELYLRSGTTEENCYSLVKSTTVPGSPVLTLTAPLDYAYPSGADVSVVRQNLASAAGTLASPVTHVLRPRADERWHITELVLIAEASATSTVDQFLSLTALTNGLIVRSNKSGEYFTYGAWQTDFDINEDIPGFKLIESAGPQTNYGQVGAWRLWPDNDYSIKLDGSLGETAEALVQDDLTGETLIKLKIKARGHIEELA